MTTLARIQPVHDDTPNHWVDLVQPAADLAAMIADTEFVPQEMRKRPAVIAACILFGAELGLGPMVSLAKIAVVKGKPAPYAELARALALGAGHEIWVDEQTNTRCKVSGSRRGSQQVHSVTWTADDVRKAGINSAMYSKYPRQMLYARASAELVRQMAPDVLGGITLFAEEAADAEPAEPTPTATEPVKATTRRRTPAIPALAPATEPDLPPLPDDTPETADGPTEAQIKRMMATFNELGIKDRADRLSFIAAAARPVASSKELTVDEAAQVIDNLDRVVRGDIDLVYVDGTIHIGAPGENLLAPEPPELFDD